MNRFIASYLPAAVVGVALFLSGGSAALADDIKIFPAATSCRLTNLGDSNNTGGVQNNSAGSQKAVYCFLVRDHPTAKPIKVEASVVDNSGSSIRCRAGTLNRYGGSPSVGAYAFTQGAARGGFVLNLPIPATVNSSGILTVDCVLPSTDGIGGARSQVVSFKLTEADPAP